MLHAVLEVLWQDSSGGFRTVKASHDDPPEVLSVETSPSQRVPRRFRLPPISRERTSEPSHANQVPPARPKSLHNILASAPNRIQRQPLRNVETGSEYCSCSFLHTLLVSRNFALETCPESFGRCHYDEYLP